MKSNKRRMSKKEIERKKKQIKKIFISTISIIIILVVGLTINDFIILDKNEKTNLVVNNENVTSNLKNDILIEDGVIYISKEDISKLFDPYIYNETETNQIITTYDKKIASIGFESNVININGSQKEIYAHAITRNEIEYLPISEMKMVYNIEIENIEESKVITIDSFDKEQKKAIISSNVAVKSSTNIFAKTVDRVKKGNSIIVISSNNGYTKIRTSNGKIGYVKSNKIENEYSVRENMIEEKQIGGEVNLVLDEFAASTKAPDRTNTTVLNANAISPSFYYLGNNEHLKENIGNRGEEYIQWAHGQGYKIWATLSNIDTVNSESVTSNILNSYEKRHNLIEEIVTSCVKYRLDGININFKNIKSEDKDMYSRFIIELAPRLNEIGLVTLVTVTANSKEEAGGFDFSVLSNIVDYISFTSNNENQEANIIEGACDENKVIIATYL